MKTTPFTFCIAALLALASWPLATATTTYQGQLKQSGSPHTGTVEMNFSLWDDETGGSRLGPVLNENVVVSEGLFQAELDFGNVFGAGELWLEIEIGGEVLTPRQKITAAPVAVHALTGGDGSPWVVLGNNDIIYQSGRVGIGINDPVATLNVVGSVAVGSFLNSASGFNSFVSGGDGADGNFAFGSLSFVGGGYGNEASGEESFIGGGDNNEASGQASFAGGGTFNQASGHSSFVGGGDSNVASENTSFVGGGSGNEAGGLSSFAAGRLAKALHHGTFVWADRSNLTADFASTGENQFLVRAGGGVGINTNDPGSFALRIDGDSIGRGGLRVDVANDTGFVPLSVLIGTVTKLRLLSDGGLSVGSGTAAPQNGLRVQGEVQLNTLASAGGTELCRNTLNRIAACNSSSSRYKKDVAGLGAAAGLIERLHPVSFRWIESGVQDVGLIAEEVAEVDPRFVTYNGDGEIEGVKYRQLSVLLVKALQEQQAENNELRAELARLREDTRARLAALEALLARDAAMAGR